MFQTSLLNIQTSAVAFKTTVLNAAALINKPVKNFNERRGLQFYCNGRRGLNIHLIFLYAAPRLSNLLEWAPRPSHGLLIFIYTQRRGPHNVCAGRRGPRADNSCSSFNFQPNSINLTSNHPRFVNMMNLNKTKSTFHAINLLNKIYH